MEHYEENKAPSNSPVACHIYPHRQIFNPNSQYKLYKSEWFHLVMTFILQVNNAVRGKMSRHITISPQCQLLIDLFRAAKHQIETFPPHTQSQRFGNTAYRQWCDGIRPMTLQYMRRLIKESGLYPADYEDFGFNPDIEVCLDQHHSNVNITAKPATGLPDCQDVAAAVIPGATLAPFGTGVVSQKPTLGFERGHGTTPTVRSPATRHPGSLSAHSGSLSSHHSSLSSHKTSHLSSSPGLSPSVSPPTPLSLHATTQQLHPSIHASQHPAPIVHPTPQEQAAMHDRYMKQVTDPHLTFTCSLAQELAGFFLDSLGNYVRIDYGTGHELAFITFLTILVKHGFLHQSDYPALGVAVFGAYLEMVRAVQQVYWLEPAGSKGAWGLDDYQFICFLWGSSQFLPLDTTIPANHGLTQSTITIPIPKQSISKSPLHPPTSHHTATSAGDLVTAALASSSSLSSSSSSSHLPDSVDESNTIRDINTQTVPLSSLTLLQIFTDHSIQTALDGLGLLFFDAVQFVLRTKRGHLQSTSPVLFSLSQLDSWQRVNTGLGRMYGGEVISKFPVVQHVKFGSLITLYNVCDNNPEPVHILHHYNDDCHDDILLSTTSHDRDSIQDSVIHSRSRSSSRADSTSGRAHLTVVEAPTSDVIHVMAPQQSMNQASTPSSHDDVIKTTPAYKRPGDNSDQNSKGIYTASTVGDSSSSTEVIILPQQPILSPEVCARNTSECLQIMAVLGMNPKLQDKPI